MPLAAALKALVSEAGRQFDPAVVQALRAAIEVHPEMLSTWEADNDFITTLLATTSAEVPCATPGQDKWSQRFPPSF